MGKNEKNDVSLYIKVLKRENGAAVIRELVVDAIMPYFREIITALIYKDRKKWEREEIYQKDWDLYLPNIKKSLKSPQNVYDTKAIFRLDELLDRTKTANKKKVTSSSADFFLNEKNRSEFTFSNVDLKDFDTAALMKIFATHMPNDAFVKSISDAETVKTLRNKVQALRKQYEGHLTENKKKKCDSDVVVREISGLVSQINPSIAQMRVLAQEQANNQAYCEIIKKCEKSFKDMFIYLEDLKKVIRELSQGKIEKDATKKYQAKDISSYCVFAVYPQARTDKFRRFINDSLRIFATVSEKCIYTDTGTVLILETLSASSDAQVRDEAKRIQKELFEPMLRLGALSVLELSDNDESFIIDVDSPSEQDMFLEKLQTVKSNVCVITEDEYLAKEVWKINKNTDIANGAVAVRPIDKQTVVPFF